jgi:hypothetical protein
MIDVNKITSTLAKLPDQQLQQYAQMHKSDPYIMALAMSESNRRKEMRAAGQGGQGMQEQPKVVDQMVAEMAPQQLPEEMGIGQLPAGEMNFAGGGIVAFADGGGVERYQTGGSIFSQMDQQKAAQLSQLNSQLAMIEPQLRAAAASGDPQAIQTYAQQAQAIRGQINAVREAAGNRIGLIESPSAPPAAPPARVAPAAPTGQFNRMAGAEQFGLPSAAAGQAARQQAEYIRQQDKLMKGYGPFRRPEEYEAEEASIAARAAKQAAAPAPRASAPRADTTKRSLSGAPASKPPTGLPGTSDLTTLYQDILGKQNFQDPAAEASLQLEAQERASAAADRQAIARDAERFKDAYKGREGRLAEREADIGKQKGTNTGLAFLNAGLAIMSTPGGLATAIGKGAQVGTAQFASGLDKIRSAQERLGEARDRLDDLKLNREDVTAKDLRDAERRYRDVAVNAQKRTIDGIRTAAGVNEKRASDLFAKTVGMAETVYKEEQANVRNRNSVQGMIDARGGTAGTREDRLKLDSLKAMATNIGNELKDPFLGLPRNAEIKKAKQAELAQINAQLAQMSGLGTMMPASPTGARGGVQFLGYE